LSSELFKFSKKQLVLISAGSIMEERYLKWIFLLVMSSGLK
jgi:hypothetical protein